MTACGVEVTFTEDGAVGEIPREHVADGARFEVVLGCSKCRLAPKGCGSCRKKADALNATVGAEGDVKFTS